MASRVEKRVRINKALAALDDAGVPYSSSNNGVHIYIVTEKSRLDYWPSRRHYKLDGTHFTGSLEEVLPIAKRVASESNVKQPRRKNRRRRPVKRTGRRINKNPLAEQSVCIRLRSKFNCQCRYCGKRIGKGEQIYYFPKEPIGGHRAGCLECSLADPFALTGPNPAGRQAEALRSGYHEAMARDVS